MNPLALLDKMVSPLATLLEKPLMKKTLLLFFVMTLLSSAWASHVGIIPFNTGETLSSSDLNENFNGLAAGVHDNAIDISTNATAIAGKQDPLNITCDAQTAIQTFSSDGTSTCVTLPVGDITDVNAGTGLTGGGASGEVTLNADTAYMQRRVGSCGVGEAIRTISATGAVTCETTGGATGAGYVTVAGAAFVEGWKHDSWFRYAFVYSFPMIASYSYGVANLQLPDNVIISELRCYYYDNHSTYDIISGKGFIYRGTHGTTSMSQIAATNAAFTSGASSVVENVVDSSIGATVDNSLYTYSLVFETNITTGYTATGSSSNIRFYGCRVYYT